MRVSSSVSSPVSMRRSRSRRCRWLIGAGFAVSWCGTVTGGMSLLFTAQRRKARVSRRAA